MVIESFIGSFEENQEEILGGELLATSVSVKVLK